MAYKMLMNQEKFLKTEFGVRMKECVEAWDRALEEQWLHNYDTEEYKRGMQSALWCQAQWEVYQLALKQFYGIECHFTRTDEYYGVCTGNERVWLVKVDRRLENSSVPAPDTGTDINKVVELTAHKACEEIDKITHHASAQEIGRVLRNLRCPHS